MTKQENLIAKLKKRFLRFRKTYYLKTDVYTGLVAEGQKPSALLIACSDSRVDPAITLGLKPGEIFMVRNVANLVPPYEHDTAQHGVSAALEYAVKHLEVEHIIINGHSQCGGIRALVEQPDAMVKDSESFIWRWMSMSLPLFEKVKKQHPEANADALAALCEQHSMLASIDNLMTFDFVRERVEQKSLKLHAWYFDLEAGCLSSYNFETEKFETLDAKD